MRGKIGFGGTGLIIGLMAATAAMALDAAAVEKARGDFFHGIGHNFKGLNDELKKPAPDIAAVKTFTAAIAAAAPNLPAQFPAGSGPESGVKTEAQPNIWTDGAKFKADADALNVAAQALNAAAQKGDLDATRTAMANAGNACKTCHQTFRKEDH